MTPGNWVAVILGTVAACWLVAFLGEVANGSSEERREYEAERAKADAEALLKGE